MQSISEFNKLPLNLRQNQVKHTLEKHPDKVAVLCEMDQSQKKLKPLEQIKYLVSTDLTLGELSSTIRKKINLDASEALFVLNYKTKKCLSSGSNMGMLYSQYKDTDLFLKLLFVSENTFG